MDVTEPRGNMPYLHHLRIIIVSLLVVYAEPCVGANLPKGAQKVLDSLPGKVLTLDLVVSKSIASSNSFRQVRSLKAGIDVAALQSRILLDYNLYAAASHSNSRPDTISPFAASRSLRTSYSLGVSTYFETGTELLVDLTTYKSDTTQGFIGDLAFYETTATVSLKQNLWKDFFGFATRLMKDAGDLNTEAAKFDFQATMEDWVQGMIGQYYNAWLDQSQVRAAMTNLKRQERLLKITKIKARRGTAEKPDVLQIESSVLAAKSNLQLARQGLSNTWRFLVTSLHFPSEWLDIDPIYVPLKLDSPVKETMNLCWKGEHMKAPPKETAQSQSAQLKAQAAAKAARSALNGLNPSVQAGFEMKTNGTDSGSRSTTFSEAFSTDHPAWTASLNVTFPIGNYAAKANAYSAVMNREASDAAAAEAAENILVDWKNSCSNLKRLSLEETWRKAGMKNQQLRAQLEEKRFSIGRSNPTQVIIAGGDATQAELAHRRTKIDLLLAAWSVRRLQNKIKPYVEGLVTKQ